MLSIVKYFKNIFHSYFLLQKVADLIFVQFLLQHRPNKVNSHMYSLNIFWFIYWFLFVFVGLKMWLRTVAWNHRYNLTYIAAKKKKSSHITVVGLLFRLLFFMAALCPLAYITATYWFNIPLEISLTLVQNICSKKKKEKENINKGFKKKK